jgi:hypothetical protein
LETHDLHHSALFYFVHKFKPQAKYSSTWFLQSKGAYSKSILDSLKKQLFLSELTIRASVNATLQLMLKMKKLLMENLQDSWAGVAVML